MDAAFRLDMQQRKARALDFRAAMAEGDAFGKYLQKLTVKG